MSENILKCHCPKCESGDEKSQKLHYFEVKDRHPEMKWKTSKTQKMQEIRDIMKSYNCDHERALKIYNGDVK